MWTVDEDAMDRRAAHRRPSVRTPASGVGHDWDKRKQMHYDSLPYPDTSEMLHTMRAPEVDDFVHEDDDTTASSSSSRRFQHHHPQKGEEQDHHHHHHHHKSLRSGKHRTSSHRRPHSAMPPAKSRVSAAGAPDPPVPYKRGTFATRNEIDDDDDDLPMPKARAAPRKPALKTRTRESSPATRKEPSPVRKKVDVGSRAKPVKTVKYNYKSPAHSRASSSTESSESSSESDTEDDDDDDEDDHADDLEIEEVLSGESSDQDDTESSDSDSDARTKKVVLRKKSEKDLFKAKPKTKSKTSTKIVHHDPRKRAELKSALSVEEIHTPSGKSSAGSRSSYVRSREMDLALARAASRGPSRRASPEAFAPSHQHPSLKRYETDLVVAPAKPPKPTLRRAHTTAGSQITASSSAASSTMRPRNVFGAMFAAPDPPPAPADPPTRSFGIRPPPAQAPDIPDMSSMVPSARAPRAAFATSHQATAGGGVECLVCMEDHPVARTAKLGCGHRMCNACIKQLFKRSITDPQHMPPRCCTVEPIPLGHVEAMFDDSFKHAWNRKFVESSGRNRLYCAAKKCNEWIKPSNITMEEGRRMGRCGRCRTKVCGSCHGRWHSSKHCPRENFLEPSRDEGPKCYRCKSIVGVQDGLNQVTCRCGAEFCVVCGTKWPNCDCPWFETDDVDDDVGRLEHMRAAMEPDDEMYGSLDVVAAPRTIRGHVPMAPQAPQAPPAPRMRESDTMVRRLQGRQEDGLARRLASMDVGDGFQDEYQEEDEYMMGGAEDVLGIGGPSGRYVPEDYRRRPQSFVVPTPPSPPPAISPHHHAPPARSPFGHPQAHSHAHAPTPPATSPFAPQTSGHAPPAPSPFAPKSPGHGLHLPHLPPHNPLHHGMHSPHAAHPPHAPHTSHAPHTPPATAFDRSGGDYVAGVSRARGVRDSMERRLADRFSENRQSSAAHANNAAPSVMSHAASMPAVPMSVPMPHSHMPHMAPPPPPPLVPMMSAPPAPGASGLRRHSLEDDMYVPFGGPMSRRASVPHPRPEGEADFTASSMRRRFDNNRGMSTYDDSPRTSSMAGLNSGRGANRVFEWRNHVEPGVPDGEDARAR